MAETKVIITAEDKTKAALASVEKGLNSLGAAATAAFAGFSVSWAAKAVNQALDFGDAIAEMSKKTGLGTSALQEFRFAAVQSGGSTEGFDKAIVKFTQTIGDAADGSQQAVQALARVGISMDDLKTKSVEKLFTQTTDSLSQMNSEAVRMSATNDLFGKQAKEMAGFFATAADEMANLREQARSMGAVLDSDTIQMSKKSKDQLEALSMVLKVNLSEALIQAAPLLIKGAEALNLMAAGARNLAMDLGLLERTSLDDMGRQRAALANEYLRLRERESKLGFTEAFVDADKKRVLAEIDALDALIIDKNKRIAKLGGEDKPALPEGTKIKGAVGDDAFLKSMRQLVADTEKLNTSLVTDEQDKSSQRLEIMKNEMLEKINYSKLTAEQRMLADEALLQWGVAASMAENDRLVNLREKHLQDLRDKVATEQEILDEQYNKKYLDLVEAEELNLLTREGFADREIELKNWKVIKLAEIEENAEKKAQALKKASGSKERDISIKILGELSTLTQSNNKRMFEIGKKAALANIVVKMSSAAADAYEQGAKVSWYLGAAYAAAVIAAGAVHFKNVQAQQFDGGASMGGAGGGAVPTYSADPNTGVPNQQFGNFSDTRDPVAPRQVNIYLSGEGRMDPSYVRDQLIPAINDAIGDGVDLRVR